MKMCITLSIFILCCFSLDANNGVRWIDQVKNNSLEMMKINHDRILSHLKMVSIWGENSPKWFVNLPALPSYTRREKNDVLDFTFNGGIDFILPNRSNFSLSISDSLNMSLNNEIWNYQQSLGLTAQFKSPISIIDNTLRMGNNWLKKEQSIAVGMAEAQYMNKKNKLLLIVFEKMLDVIISKSKMKNQESILLWENEKTQAIKNLMDNGYSSWSNYFDQLRMSRNAKFKYINATNEYNIHYQEYCQFLNTTSAEIWIPKSIPNYQITNFVPDPGLWLRGQALEDDLLVSEAGLRLEKAKENH